VIRVEHSADVSAIHALTEIAFRDMPFSDGDEQDLIDRLRALGALTLSLVAVVDAEVVGHIAFSPATAADGSHPWFALGPVSVAPELQGQGIGSALIERGLEIIKGQGALGCILTGNPQYYRRFGFELAPGNAPSGEPEQYFMLKLIAAPPTACTLHFHDAFHEDFGR